MLELYLRLNCNFTESDKEECKVVIFRLMDLANLARREGVLALEREMSEEQSVFLKTAISLVVDGTDPALVEKILQAVILSGEYSGFQLLSRLLMAEGVLSLQCGENPRIILMKLSAIMGEKYILQMADEYFAKEGSHAVYYRVLASVRGKQPFPESALFEKKLLQIDNRSLQLVLRGLDYSALQSALRGCGYTLIQKVFDNLSIGMCSMLAKEWDAEQSPNKEYVIYCQNHILDKITELESKGEIIDISKFILAGQ